MATRKRITDGTMRKLFMNSGGRCAVEGCSIPLLEVEGGWGGTIAHIVGAEVSSARGKSDLSPEDRRGYDNLILCCAFHGRTIDDPETGEKVYPVERLKLMKEKHEKRVAKAVTQAIEGERSGADVAPRALDTSLRPSTRAEHARPFGEFLGMSDDDGLAGALMQIESRLNGLSETALSTLAKVLELWQNNSRDGASWSFPLETPEVSFADVTNRKLKQGEDAFEIALRELDEHGIVKLDHDEDAAWVGYRLPLLLANYGASSRENFWSAAAIFLWEAHAILIADWVIGLNFALFDEEPPAERDVSWPRGQS